MVAVLLVMIAAAIGGVTLPLWRPLASVDGSLGRGGRFALLGGLAALLVVATTAIYAGVGRPDLTGVAGKPAMTQAAPSLTAELEQRVLSAPNDPAGWARLGVAYGQAGRFTDAVMVFGRAARLSPGSADFPSAEGEALTQAAHGQVTAPAGAAFKAALNDDPADPRARYYLALMKYQAGDRAQAARDWDALLKSAPAGAPWVAQVRAYVARATAKVVRSGNQ